MTHAALTDPSPQDGRDEALCRARGSAAFLRKYNDWRRASDGTHPMPDPTEIGVHIDQAAEVLERISEMLPRLEGAYIAHRKTTACDTTAGHGKCTGCHWWQGAMSALHETLGERGTIFHQPNHRG